MSKFVAALKPALWTALFVFTGIFLPALFGWTQDAINAVGSGTFVWPDVDTLGKAGLAGFGAAASGLVNFIVRYAQELGLLPGKTPVYTPTDTPHEG